MNDDYPMKFDTSKIDDIGKKNLKDFYQRRKIFDKYLKEKEIKLFTCPSCGYPTLNERGGYDICNICGWEDDDQDDPTADEILGGPNSNLSLTDSRLKIGVELNILEKNLKGTINLNPEEVIKILSTRADILESFCKEKITILTDRNDPVWQEYNKLEKNTLSLLIKDS